MKIAIVVPTIRENSIQRFLTEWNKEFTKHKVTVFLVEDNPERTFRLDTKSYGFSLKHFAWSDIEKDLGKNSWVIPRRSSAIKSYGFYKAYKARYDVIVALDDDCYPLDSYDKGFNKGSFLKGHLDALENPPAEEAWFSTMAMSGDIRPRGLPYKNTKRSLKGQVVLNHGLWANVPDFDGVTQLKFSTFPNVREYFKSDVVPLGAYFPMCGMNLMWKRELTPAMYFMLMGKDKKETSWGFDRFDDIWGGIFAKKIADHLGYRMTTGYPAIWHDRASDPHKNVEKEKSGLPVNENLWAWVDGVRLTEKTVAGCYAELARKMPAKTEYMKKLKRAMGIWAGLFA